MNGAVGVVVAPRGWLQLAITFAIEHERILEYQLIADPERLGRLELAIVDQ